MRWLGRLILLSAALYLAAVAVVLWFIQAYPQPQTLPENAIVVILGAAQHDDGTLGPSSVERVLAGVELFQRIGTRRLVVTGGALDHEVLPVAESMATMARAAGVPDDRLTVEPRALSTLQNALFTAQLLGADRDAPLVLLTHRYHLPRAWASFRWAGMRDLTLYAADGAGEHWQRIGMRTVLVEGVKALGNLARAGVASAADLLGMTPETYMPLLD